jgi:hypothetical protein
VNNPISALYQAAASSFGPAPTETGITGAAALASPAEACTAVSGVSGKIAIVDRGTCNFTDKVKNAQAAGATAVIIVNNVDGAIFSPGATGSTKTIKISSVMISKADGKALKGLASPNVTVQKANPAPPKLDGSVDADIVFHEYGHGLTWRMIGGMSGPLAGAIGEGASDVNAFLQNGDDRIGEYSSSDPAGIRRYPYAGYPLTYGDVTGAEVHADGEVYAAAMWHLKELFDGAGLATSTLQDYFVDGMNFTPSTPAFEDMRNGMLQAASPNAGHCDLIWQAFSQFGIGLNANGIAGSTSVSITEDFNPGNGCTIP